MNDVFESEHLKFRPMTEDDTDRILKWRNSEAVKRNFLYRRDITREQHLERFRTKVRSGEVIQFIIIDKEGDKPIGSVYLRDVDPVKKSAEYGVFIGEETARGKGYGSETAQSMVTYFFGELKYDHLFLRVLKRNAAAIRSYENAGFKTVEGPRPIQADIENGEEVMYMSITREQINEGCSSYNK